MRVLFMGTPDFAVPCLDALVENKYNVVGVVTQPDKPFGRKQSELKAPPVKEAAIKHGIVNILQPAKVRTPEFLEAVRALEPDLVVTAAYGRILTKNVLEVPKLGCINVHASLLPKYRGAAPIQWAIINGDEKTGITTMFMDEGMDTGDILLTREIRIPPDMTSGELFDELKALGSEVLLETMKALEAGTLERMPQDHSKAVNVPMITKELGQIDWASKASDIHNLVRGTNPWPGAFTYYKGSRMKIWKTAVVENCPVVKPVKPGTIMKIQKDSLIVAAGDVCLHITELQFDNCKRMNASECGHNMDEGEVLG
ncbi:MAG TPA: methionyl-tRNA formyltransferase [Clostridia bacterium]|nr:methionyl-tRNA formyltransferase [Clostridia bacterium]